MKRIIILLIMLCMSGSFIQQAQAQIPIVSVITGIIKKAIKAIDLKIQQEQNKVIWLQNAQKQLENAMSKLKLNDISQWTEKQRKLYADYFDELKKVKAALSTYSEVKNMIRQQHALVDEYNTAWGLLRNDRHFTAQELQQMSGIYSGILDASLTSIEELDMIITSFSTQMSDGKRMELMQHAAKDLDRNISSLRSFNNYNARLSLSRASDEHDAQLTRNLYGL